MFFLGDHFIDSHNFSLQCMDNCKEKIDLGHYWGLKGLKRLQTIENNNKTITPKSGSSRLREVVVCKRLQL